MSKCTKPFKSREHTTMHPLQATFLPPHFSVEGGKTVHKGVIQVKKKNWGKKKNDGNSHEWTLSASREQQHAGTLLPALQPQALNQQHANCKNGQWNKGAWEGLIVVIRWVYHHPRARYGGASDLGSVPSLTSKADTRLSYTTVPTSPQPPFRPFSLPQTDNTI